MEIIFQRTKKLFAKSNRQINNSKIKMLQKFRLKTKIGKKVKYIDTLF